MKKLLLILILFFASVHFADAAIARQSTAGNGSGNFSGTGSKTFAITVDAGDNRLLVVGVYAGLQKTPVEYNVTGVTYNGVAMTEAGHNNTYAAGATSVWYLAAPDVGTYNVVVTWSGTTSEGNAWAQVYTGTDGLRDAVITGGETNNTTLTLSITTVADNAWGFASIRNSNGVPIGGTGVVHTSVYEVGGNGFFDNYNTAITPAGAKSNTYTRASACAWAGVIMSFAPGTQAGPAPAYQPPQDILWLE